MLYTAVTRARQGVVLIGQAAAVHHALINTHTRRRMTALDHRIARRAKTVPVTRRTGTDGQLSWD
ncbi:hypothetical protein CTZ27_37365 [Streptomyces griseocarneus]|nr:hypothetical protein CTZ27_37365 [Streptomyces griseocarneus]